MFLDVKHTNSEIPTVAVGANIAIPRDSVIDLVISHEAGPGNPFDAEYRVTLRGPGSYQVTVPGFFEPDRGHIARVSMPSQGSWKAWVSQSPDDEETLPEWAFEVTAPLPGEHGALQIDPEHPRHFIHADGTEYFLMGYEVDWLAMIDHHDTQLTRVNEFLDSIQAAGFNFVTMNAYAHSFRQHVPAELEADSRWVVPQLSPWVGGNADPDYSTLDASFFAHLDRVFLALQSRGMIAHLMIHVYNKDVNWPELGSADDDRFWRHVVARYQAFPNIVWDTAKESYHQPASYIWTRVALIRSFDGYRRLLTVHDANPPHDVSWGRQYLKPENELIDALTDFTSDQILQDINADAQRRTTRHAKPYVNIEFGYESGVEDLPSDAPDHNQDWQEVTRRMWQVVMGGGYPNYYYRNTAWSLFIPFPPPPGYAAVRTLVDFWAQVNYKTLLPARDEIVALDAATATLSDPGREIVAYSQSAASFSLDLGSTTFQGTWVDPLSGAQQHAGTFTGTSRLTPPDGWQSAVLHLTA